MAPEMGATILIGFAYLLPALANLFLLKVYFVEDWKKNRWLFILMPGANIMIFCFLLSFRLANPRLKQEALDRRRQEERIQHMETFLRYHGYTWDDVDEFVDSLGLVEKFKEAQKNR